MPKSLLPSGVISKSFGYPDASGIRGEYATPRTGYMRRYWLTRHRSDLVATVIINDPSAYRDILSGGSIGAAESYVRGAWSSPDLVRVIRLVSRNLQQLDQLEQGASTT